MLSTAMEAALNHQINVEMESSYIYLAMAAYAEAQDHPGAAGWLRAQSREELAHAMKFYEYIHARGGRVLLQAIPQPPAEFGTLVDLFDAVLEHEQTITGRVHRLYELALAEKDYASFPLLQWFLAEQVEEEKAAEDVLRMVRAAGLSGQALLFVDAELGKRQLK
ncbi:MAG TPA: ferritin [Symbiobacteriaceae bacterium]|nr:ferritin [Symbiobacteriaceae bacterium]